MKRVTRVLLLKYWIVCWKYRWKDHKPWDKKRHYTESSQCEISSMRFIQNHVHGYRQEMEVKPGITPQVQLGWRVRAKKGTWGKVSDVLQGNSKRRWGRKRQNKKEEGRFSFLSSAEGLLKKSSKGLLPWTDHWATFKRTGQCRRVKRTTLLNWVCWVLGVRKTLHENYWQRVGRDSASHRGRCPISLVLFNKKQWEQEANRKMAVLKR